MRAMKYRIIEQIIYVVRKNKFYIFMSILLVVFTPYLKKIGLF